MIEVDEQTLEDLAVDKPRYTTLDVVDAFSSMTGGFHENAIQEALNKELIFIDCKGKGGPVQTGIIILEGIRKIKEVLEEAGKTIEEIEGKVNALTIDAWTDTASDVCGQKIELDGYKYFPEEKQLWGDLPQKDGNPYLKVDDVLIALGKDFPGTPLEMKLGIHFQTKCGAMGRLVEFAEEHAEQLPQWCTKCFKVVKYTGHFTGPFCECDGERTVIPPIIKRFGKGMVVNRRKLPNR